MTIEDVKNTVEDTLEAESPLPDMSILRQGRRQPPMLPLEAFGTAWCNWLSAAAEGAGAPIDYVAGTLLAATASLIGNARRVSVWDGWEEPAALWIANVGNPSSGKSPAADPVLHLLRAIEQDLSKGFEEKHREWQTAHEAASHAHETWQKAVKNAVKNGTEPPVMPAAAEKPPEVVRPRILGHDASIEKLGMLLAAHDKGMLFHRDELSGWFGSFDRYNGNGSDRAFWTEAYGGRAYSIDRVKHLLPINIPHLLVGIMGGIQPDKLVEIMRGADDGLIARFLWIWPDPIPPFRPQRYADSSLALTALRRIVGLSLDADIYDGIHRPRKVPLSMEASDRFQSWREKHYAAEQNVTGLLASTYGKANGHVLRLALTLEYLWWAITAETPEPNVISTHAIDAAICLIESYFKPMSEGVFGDAAIPEEERLATTLALYIVKIRPTIINLRTIRREAKLPGLRKIEKVKLAVDALVEAGWIFQLASKKPGRPREDYTINPKLWEMLPE